MPASSTDTNIIKTSSSVHKLESGQYSYNTRGHNESLGSTVSSANSQCYIKPLELRGSPLYFSKPGDKQATYQNYFSRNSTEPPPLMPRPIPFTPVQAAPPPLPQRIDQQVPGLLMTQQITGTLNSPFLPPKQHNLHHIGLHQTIRTKSVDSHNLLQWSLLGRHYYQIVK